MNGKLTCETLKKVRKQIADANGIPYEPAVCNHKGNCPGTCPACEAEVRYIERELAARKNEKKHLHIVGVAKDLLPSKEDFAKHAAAVAIAAATS
ncbi:MAG: membrane receptor RagA, partial [Paludibacteraceae bacterium]|nr:membrane receptor RagA [Paludibacteraceae bacterium]